MNNSRFLNIVNIKSNCNNILYFLKKIYILYEKKILLVRLPNDGKSTLFNDLINHGAVAQIILFEL